MKLKLIMVMLLSWFSTLWAQANEIQDIQKRGKIIVAMPQKDAVPFYYVDDQGNPQGIDVELAYGIGNILGVEVEFNRDAKTFSDVVDLVKNKQADIALCKLSITMSRLSEVAFSDSYIDLHHALIVNRTLLAKLSVNKTKTDAIRAFAGKIGVIGGSSYEEYANFQFPDAKEINNIIGLSSWKEVTNQLENGVVSNKIRANIESVDAAYRDEVEVRLFMQNDKKHAVNFISVLLTDSLDRKGIAVHQDHHSLRNLLNHYLKNLNLNLTADKVLDNNKDHLEEGDPCKDEKISKECKANIISTIEKQVRLLTPQSLTNKTEPSQGDSNESSL